LHIKCQIKRLNFFFAQPSTAEASAAAGTKVSDEWQKIDNKKAQRCL